MTPRLALSWAAALVALGLLSGMLWYRGQAISATAARDQALTALSAAAAREAQAQEAMAVHRAHLDRIEAERAAAAARDAEFGGMEGSDAAASDFLRRAVDRVR